MILILILKSILQIFSQYSTDANLEMRHCPGKWVEKGGVKYVYFFFQLKTWLGNFFDQIFFKTGKIWRQEEILVWRCFILAQPYWVQSWSKLEKMKLSQIFKNCEDNCGWLQSNSIETINQGEQHLINSNFICHRTGKFLQPSNIIFIYKLILL